MGFETTPFIWLSKLWWFTSFLLALHNAVNDGQSFCAFLSKTRYISGLFPLFSELALIPLLPLQFFCIPSSMITNNSPFQCGRHDFLYPGCFWKKDRSPGIRSRFADSTVSRDRCRTVFPVQYSESCAPSPTPWHAVTKALHSLCREMQALHIYWKCAVSASSSPYRFP